MTDREIVSDHEAVDISRVPWEELVQFGHLDTETHDILFKCGFWREDKLVKSGLFSQDTDFNSVKPYFPFDV